MPLLAGAVSAGAALALPLPRATGKNPLHALAPGTTGPAALPGRNVGAWCATGGASWARRQEARQCVLPAVTQPLRGPPHRHHVRLRGLHHLGAACASDVVVLEGALQVRRQAVHQVVFGGLLWVERAAVGVEHDLRIIADARGRFQRG